MEKRPNILWYCTDQQRFDTIGALGNPHIHTPRLDEFGTAVGHIHPRLLSISHLHAFSCEFHDRYVSVRCERHRQRQPCVS